MRVSQNTDETLTEDFASLQSLSMIPNILVDLVESDNFHLSDGRKLTEPTRSPIVKLFHLSFDILVNQEEGLAGFGSSSFR